MKFTELTTEQEVLALIEFHNTESEYVVIDIETTGLNPFTDSITDIVLSGYSTDEAVIFSSLHTLCLKSLRKPVVAHNFKFDFNFLSRNGVELRFDSLHADTLLLDHLLDENQEHSLDAIVQRRYADNYKDLFWNEFKNFTDAPKERQTEYACKDVIYTAKIYRDLTSDLKRDCIPDSLIQHVHQLAFALYRTELEGIKLDLDYLNKMSGVISHRTKIIHEDMRREADLACSILEAKEYEKELSLRKTDKGKTSVKWPIFNFDSSKQLSALLYDQLKLPTQYSKTRSVTVDDAALEKLEPKHRIISLIREYRGLQKVFTAFIEGSLSKMQGGRIYPHFNVNGTVTGRISSSSPNMQQLPTHGGVRGIYIPSEGRRFISCDYSQLEVTLAAHFSRDANLFKIVYEGASQHDITASGLGIPRNQAKTINFAMQYGAGTKKIQAILNCSEKAAKEALDKYWETYSGLAGFIKECHSKVDSGIPLINPFGRKRRFPTKFKDHWAKERAKRQAANSLIQGTGADITNMAFWLVNNSLLHQGLGKALFPIHDEILIEVKEEETERSATILASKMVAVGKYIRLSVPLSVQCSKPMLRWEKS